MTDIIDLLAGLEPGSALARLRDERPGAREHAQRSFEVLLEPAAPGTFTLGERYAVATFVAGLHGFDDAAALYDDLLGDESPELREPIAAAVASATRVSATTPGPYGVYREPGLAAESVAGDAWSPDAAASEAVGTRLAAALAHAQLLVVRPRESTPAALRALVEAGWGADDIVSLSQLIGFLAFQLRTA